MATFGERLKSFRERANLSQSALAESAGITKSYISRLESGEREPASRSVALRLARELHLSLREIELWLMSAGYVSPRMQEMSLEGESRLLEVLDGLHEDSGEPT